MTQVDMLKDMFHKQELLNARIGVNCAAMNDEQRQQWILNYCRALSQETAELTAPSWSISLPSLSVCLA